METIEKKCRIHGKTTHLFLQIERLNEPVEACVRCLTEKIEEVHRERDRAHPEYRIMKAGS